MSRLAASALVLVVVLVGGCGSGAPSASVDPSCVTVTTSGDYQTTVELIGVTNAFCDSQVQAGVIRVEAAPTGEPTCTYQDGYVIGRVWEEEPGAPYCAMLTAPG